MAEAGAGRGPISTEERSWSAGALLRLISSGQARTRAGLAELTGLARSTVSQRVDALIASRLVVEVGEGISTGGRRPMMLAVNHAAGVVLAVDLGATHCRLAVADLGLTVLEELAADLDIAQGPDVVLEWVGTRLEELLERCGRTPADVHAVGIGVPGPVEFATGTPVRPPIMPGWDGVPVPERLAGRFRVPVLVDNDVNIMALGEHWSQRRESEHLLFVKVATGIGCGIISHGQVHRGADGAAGDIGHIRVSGADEFICPCGNAGCVEAVASGAAMARRLRAAGLDVHASRDVVRLVQQGHPDATRAVREAGRYIGEVLAALVSFYNPDVIVVGGDVAGVHDLLLAGIRGAVYERALPLATRKLQIVPGALGDRAGVVGAAVLAAERALSPREVDRALAAAAATGASYPANSANATWLGSRR